MHRQQKEAKYHNGEKVLCTKFLDILNKFLTGSVLRYVVHAAYGGCAVQRCRYQPP